MGQEVQRWDALAVQGFHLDVMDGHFVPNLTFGPDLVAALRPYTQKIFDVHLMVEAPEMFVDRFIKAGADRLSFHVELPMNPGPLIQTIKEAGKQVGLALNPGTPAEALFPYLGQLDFILLMTVQPGFSGGQFRPEALDKIPLLLERAPHLKITVDGAMGPETIQLATARGAQQIVSGSKLFQGGPECYAKNLMAMRQNA